MTVDLDRLNAEIQRLTRERDEAQRAVEEELEKRDSAMEWADQLALAIAPVEVIGEHTSSNEPWVNALEIAESRPAIPADAADLAWSACMDDDKFTDLASDQILEVIRRTLKAVTSAPVSGSDTTEDGGPQ